MNLIGVLEGILFVVGDEGLTLNQICDILDIDMEKASEEDLDEQGFSGLKDDDSTLESSKEAAEKDGATCEVK